MMIFVWFKRFKNGKTSTNNDKHSSRPSTSRPQPLIVHVKTSVDYPRSCRRGWNIHWFTSQNSKRFRNAIGLSNLCQDSPLMVRNYKDLPSICENLLQMSLLVMMWMMMKQNNSHIEKVLLCLAPRKHDRCTCECQ
jgi:hypothetical protein